MDGKAHRACPEFAEVAGGLPLLSDTFHSFTDAIALVLALVARRAGRLRWSESVSGSESESESEKVGF